MQDVMSVNHKEYKIAKLLGHGKGGYSYLAEREGNFYVLKQIHHEQIFYIDYECNNYMDEWNFENWGIKYWSKTQEFIEYVEQH